MPSRVLHRNAVPAYISRLPRIDVWRRLAVFAGWRERTRQRRELMTLVRDGFDFSDAGVTRALAAQEAGKFPWQAFDERWQDAANAQSKVNAPT